MKLIEDLIEQIEGATQLDRFTKPVVAAAQKAVKPTAVRNALSGTMIGHPAHPMLTDLPIGAWTSAAILDVFGGKAGRRSADMLVKAGILAALPTAASGLNDMSDTFGGETRLAFVHGAANAGALVLYCLSSRARKRGRRGTGKLMGFAGLGAMAAGGYLGGHLAFAKGVNVNRLAWEYRPTDWTSVLADSELLEGEHRKVDAAGVGVLVWRDGETLRAISATCSHMGGPLDEGPIADGCVTCPWHGSVFRMRDGGIERGPACVSQPVFETRVNEGQIEVRSA